MKNSHSPSKFANRSEKRKVKPANDEINNQKHKMFKEMATLKKITEKLNKFRKSPDYAKLIENGFSILEHLSSRRGFLNKSSNERNIETVEFELFLQEQEEILFSREKDIDELENQLSSKRKNIMNAIYETGETSDEELFEGSSVNKIRSMPEFGRKNKFRCI